MNYESFSETLLVFRCYYVNHQLDLWWSSQVPNCMETVRMMPALEAHMLTHWGRDKMVAISQTTFWNEFSILNENVWITINISLKIVPMGPIDNIPALVQIMVWRRPGDKPLSEPMMVRLATNICVTRPQWVNLIFSGSQDMYAFGSIEPEQQEQQVDLRWYGWHPLEPVYAFPLDQIFFPEFSCCAHIKSTTNVWCAAEDRESGMPCLLERDPVRHAVHVQWGDKISCRLESVTISCIHNCLSSPVELEGEHWKLCSKQNWWQFSMKYFLLRCEGQLPFPKEASGHSMDLRAGIIERGRLILYGYGKMRWSSCHALGSWEPCSWNCGKAPGPWFNIKMSSYQYRKSHCGDKMVVRSSYLHNGISYTGKMASLNWTNPQAISIHNADTACIIPE